MRGLKRLASARTVAAGHAFVQNLRRGHHELTTELPTHERLRAAFTEPVLRLSSRPAPGAATTPPPR